MTEQEIRTEYIRLFKTADMTGRLSGLNGLQREAHDAGFGNWEQLIEARIARHEANYSRAIDLSTRLVEDPQTTEDVKYWARFNRGATYGQNGDADKAMADYSAVIDDPSAPPELRAMTRASRGMTYAQKGDADKAIADYSAVIDDPNAPPERRARVSRGVMYGQKGDADKEIADYNAVIDDPDAPPEDRAMARVNRGNAYQKGDADKAIADYSAVIDDPIAPPDARVLARFNRGKTYLRKGATSLGEADFIAALAQSGTSPEFRNALLAYANLLSQGTAHADTAVQAVMELKLDAKTRADFEAGLGKEKKRKRDFFGASRFQPEVSFLLAGREWNSFTPAVPGLNEPSRGGGYFIRHHQTGIVVDPGFDFLEIFAKSGGTLRDIDHIVITHAHNDHTAELEALLTLLHEFNDSYRNDPVQQKMVRVYLSQGAARKFAGLLQLKGCNYIGEVVTLNRGRKDNPQVIWLSDDVSLKVLPAYHDDVMTEDYAVGLGFEFRFGTEVRRIVLTGDTALFPAAGKDSGKPQRAVYQEYAEPFCPPNNADLVVAHIGTISQSDLRQPWGTLETGKQTLEPTGPKRTAEKEEGWNHLCLRGIFSVLYGLRPRAAIISEFGEEMKTIWIKAVRTLGREVNKVFEKTDDKRTIPVFAGDPVLVYNIGTGQFLCHEDLQFHNPDEVRMLGINDPEKGQETAHRRPYLFLKHPQLDDPSEYEDRVRAFHKALKERTLPHFSPKDGDA